MPARFDDFNRANATGLGSPSDGGSAWWDETFGFTRLTIKDQKVSYSSGGATGYSGLDASTNVGRAKIVIDTARVNGIVGLMMRLNPSNGHGMLIYWNFELGTISLRGWQRFVFGTATVIATPGTPANGTIFEVEVFEDNTYAVYVDGVQVGTRQAWASSPTWAENNTYHGVYMNALGLLSPIYLDDYTFTPAGNLEVEIEGETVLTGADDPVQMVVIDAALTRDIVLRNTGGSALSIGTITVGSGLTITADPSNSEIAASGTATLTLSLDTSVEGEFDALVTIPYGSGSKEFTVTTRWAATESANINGTIYSIGNSQSANGVPWTIGTGSGYHFYYGQFLHVIAASNLYGDPPGLDWTPAHWPIALRGGLHEWVSLQTFSFDAQTNIDAAQVFIDVMHADAKILLHPGWLYPGSGGYDANITMNDAWEAGVIAANPGRTFASTKADSILGRIYNDPDAPAGINDTDNPDGIWPTGEGSNPTHVSSQLGQWLVNNLFRAAMGKERVFEYAAGNRVYVTYLNGIIDDEFPGTEYVPAPIVRVTGSTLSFPRAIDAEFTAF